MHWSLNHGYISTEKSATKNAPDLCPNHIFLLALQSSVCSSAVEFV